MPRAARVLAVDDNPGILDILREFLEARGYDVATARNGGDAMMILATSAFDVVLLDVRMPRVDGIAALRHIRTLHPELPVIMLTGNADIELARSMLKLGAFDYIAKPVDFVTICCALSKRQPRVAEASTVP